MLKIAVKRLIRNEKGQAMALVVILLFVGALTVPSLLSYMGTALNTGNVYERGTAELYAADAGAEDGLWQVENEKLADLFPDYDEYHYNWPWYYSLDEQVNYKDVNVTIENAWMPMGIPVPDADTARQIIEEGKLIIAGAPTLTQYEIKIFYDPCGGIPAVETIGIWLPPGFEYDDNCDLEGEDYYSEPTVTIYKGGYAVVWSFSPPVSLADFPSSFAFQYSGPGGRIPSAAMSWIDTTGGYTWDADVKVYRIVSTATDPGTGTQAIVESYNTQVEVRKLGSALAGDYHAIGATLMTPTGSPYYRDRLFRESSATVTEGDIPSNAIIAAAYLYWSGWIEHGEGAILWSDDCANFNKWNPGSSWSIYNSQSFRGHYNSGGESARRLTMKNSIDLSAAPSGTEVKWQQREDGYLESDDALRFQFSADGGSTWGNLITAFSNDIGSSWETFSYTIPDEYLTANFKMRFYLKSFSGSGEYAYIDDILISEGATYVETAKVNRVMFGTTGNMTQITADQWQVAPTPESGALESWSYSCFYDATDIVRTQLDPDTRSGTFTLGHVLEGNTYALYPNGYTDYPLATPALQQVTQYQWTYAGWSLLIIYSSRATKGHQLYLFDDFHYVGLNTLLTFPISGFLAPDDPTGSHLTYFVGEGDNHYTTDYIKLNGYKLPQPGDPYEPYQGFNPQNNVFNSYSNSLDDPYLSGIDIDTFDMSDCIEPGDSSADVILNNGVEIYNLIYIILSFRSDITSGGFTGYLIR